MGMLCIKLDTEQELFTLDSSLSSLRVQRGPWRNTTVALFNLNRNIGEN